jgi:hypothetical protein
VLLVVCWCDELQVLCAFLVKEFALKDCVYHIFNMP